MAKKVKDKKVKGYCVKCRKTLDMAGAKMVKMKGGRHAMQGKCPKCGTKVFRILGK